MNRKICVHSFNLDRYFERPNLKLVTRDGRPAKIYFQDPGVAVMCKNADGSEELYMMATDVIYADFSNLFFKVEEKEGWMNINRYGDDRKSYVDGSVIFPTREEALKARSGHCVDTVRVIWSE